MELHQQQSGSGMNNFLVPTENKYMCTVTYIPSKTGFILTSSRDERTFRPTLAPQEYVHNDETLVYPKDELAGGTWIASSNNKRIACLLNGAFENHEKKKIYTKSRGLILLESFKYNTIGDFIDTVNTENVEPFTLLLIDHKNTFEFTEFRWDGILKHVLRIDKDSKNIWSSATLYNKYEQSLRSVWFNDWTEKYSEIEDRNIFNFHNKKHSDNKQTDILMNRGNGLQTLSITQIIINDKKGSMSYFDLINNTNKQIE